VTELRAGVVTFFTSSYIIFVQPAVLSSAGMDFGAVMTATCLGSAIGCLIMGLWANYPIALAPGMGINFYFTYTVVLGQGIPWEIALGAVFLSGVILILLTIFRFRELIINIIPDYLKNGIAAGIGIFITFIGFVQGGVGFGPFWHFGSIGRPKKPIRSIYSCWGFNNRCPFAT